MDAQALNLLNGQSSGSVDGLTTIGSSLGGMIAFITIISVVVTIAMLVLWAISYLHRRKMQNAIIEIRDILAAMNAREKMREQPPQGMVPNESHSLPPQR